VPGREKDEAREAGRPPRVRDVSGSLTRQAFVIAAITLTVDCLFFYLYPGFSSIPVGWRCGMLAAIVLADAGLACPPRLSGVVAVVQAIVTVGGTWVAVAVLGAVPHPAHAPVPLLNRAGLLISAYRAGAWLNRRPAVTALVCLAAGTAARQALGGAHVEGGPILVNATTDALLPWLVGRYTTTRRAYLAELEQRAAREQREARQALATAIAEERSSIARDLHDVISHHVSAIGVHAGVARLRAAATPDSQNLTTSLTAVEVSSRAAMLDLRRLLDVLHGNVPGEDSQPGLDNLPELLDSVRAVGLHARVTNHGVPSRLPESLDIAVYRVVQELLTNALRHGTGGVADVELRYDHAGLTVTATNPIATETHTRPDSPHRGLQGIRSRATMFGGSIGYGPAPDGSTWTTTVTFPLDPP
jgi:signal transduction histidine kinase